MELKTKKIKKMKYCFIILISVLYTVSCRSKINNNYETLITQKVKSVLDDPASYQSISFSKLDTLYTINLELDNLEDKKKKENEWYLFKSKMTLGESFVWKKNFEERYKISEDSLKQNIDKNKIGAWLLYHDFRAKNKFNALEKQRIFVTINLDKDSIFKIRQF